jgi:hypothetical protein
MNVAIFERDAIEIIIFKSNTSASAPHANKKDVTKSRLDDPHDSCDMFNGICE